jgi:hypothetical protein
MDFQQRLQKAIERGLRAGSVKARAEAERAVTEKELHRLHSQYRLSLSERIERCLRQLVDQFPGFQFASVVDERGWGAAISRDDLQIKHSRERSNGYSRLEMVIRPVSPYFVLELAAKAAIRNKEVINRNHFQQLPEIDPTSFEEMIDNWALEFAELYAAGS